MSLKVSRTFRISVETTAPRSTGSIFSPITDAKSNILRWSGFRDSNRRRMMSLTLAGMPRFRCSKTEVAFSLN